MLGTGVSEFLVSSAGCLVFVLFVLSGMSASIPVEGSDNRIVRAFETILVSVLSFVLMAAVTIGFANRTYVFTADTAVILLKKSAAVAAYFSTSKLVSSLSAHLQAIVLFSVLFAVFRAFFAEILFAVFRTALKTVFKKKGGGGEEAHG